MTDACIIRPARPDDLGALPCIERAAAAQFHTTPYAYLADDSPVSADGILCTGDLNERQPDHPNIQYRTGTSQGKPVRSRFSR
jgi:hypothetical protein